MKTYTLMGREVRDAQPGETVVGCAGSLSSDYLVIYTLGIKARGGVVVRFKQEADQWECYCNDVIVEIGDDGFVSSFDITKRMDGQ